MTEQNRHAAGINLRALLRKTTSLILVVSGAGLLALGRRPPLSGTAPLPSRERPPSAVQLSGAAAKKYLEQPGDGESLMAALTAARFGLKWQEHAPGESKGGGGYLGMSHDQHLNAWFADDGVTVRPTLPEAKRDQAWSIALRLKAYGYGKALAAAPPIVSQQVKENRVEYVRQDCQFSNRKLIEWYENRPEGIEQGFTLNEQPTRSDAAITPEPLRVLLAVTGDLMARRNDAGEIELADSKGKGALSYSKLVALDADGKRLATRMEASPDGCEIALMVEDAGARYPVVIDPIVASLEKKLDSGSFNQADARFGFDVAVDQDTAVVGAWRQDTISGSTTLFDVGYVYYFVRSGTAWSGLSTVGAGSSAGDACGWSVAISGGRVVYGCPGADNNSGKAFIVDLKSNDTRELRSFAVANDRYGASIAMSGNNIVVGAPFGGTTDFGFADTFTVDPALNVTSTGEFLGANNNDELGISVAIDGDTVVLGAPGVNTGRVYVASINTPVLLNLLAIDGASGDQFGQSVAISGNTAVVGAPFNNEKGSGAGAAYVFVRDGNGNWSQQQKLTGSDTTVSNFLGASHIAIQGNTIVAGAYGYSYFDINKGTIQNSGEAYVFMRRGTVWTEQAILVGDNHANDEFGVGVGISGNTVIAGARKAAASGVASAGAAFVYRLSCVPPRDSFAGGPPFVIFCPGDSIIMGAVTNNDTGATLSYQWRKNGVEIPNATGDFYTIDNVTSSDAGSYDVIVSNACGSDISAPYLFSVYAFSLNPTSENFGVSGSNGVVNVTSTGSTCSWTAVSNSSFITINSGSSGTGNGTVAFTVAANPNPGQRTGTITIAGLTFSVSQDGTNCSYSIAPTSQTLSASASTNTVAVTAGAGCNWTATSNDPSFLSINSGGSGAGNGTMTYTVAANSTTAPRTGTLTIAGQTFTVTQNAPGSIGNVSTRLPVGTGDNALFVGFTVVGPQGSAKKVIVRAIGPSLGQFGITDALANPTMEIHDSDAHVVATNNDWKSTQVGGLITGDQSAEISNSGVAPADDLESAIIANLAPGTYTAVVRGVGDTTGTGLVDAYDLSGASPARLANVATRGLVQAGDGLMIAGFIVQNAPVRAVIRAIGPSLKGEPFKIDNALADTTLELHGDDDQTFMPVKNDDWKSNQQQELENTGLQPSNDLESAMVVTLQPGTYTAQLRGKNDTSGIGVVEVYFLQ